MRPVWGWLRRRRLKWGGARAARNQHGLATGRGRLAVEVGVPERQVRVSAQCGRMPVTQPSCQGHRHGRVAQVVLGLEAAHGMTPQRGSLTGVSASCR